MRAKKKSYSGHQVSKLATYFGLSKYTSHKIVGYEVVKHFGLMCGWRSALNHFFENKLKVEGMNNYVPNQKINKTNTQYSRNKASSDSFLTSYEWRKIRLVVLKRDGSKCACCGASPESGAVMNVDHIKPRKVYPELALDLNNLQVLCSECNHGKGNWDMTDFRTGRTETVKS